MNRPLPREPTPPVMDNILQEVTAIRHFLEKRDRCREVAKEWLQVGYVLDVLLFRVYLVAMVAYSITLGTLWSVWQVAWVLQRRQRQQHRSVVTSSFGHGAWNWKRPGSVKPCSSVDREALVKQWNGQIVPVPAALYPASSVIAIINLVFIYQRCFFGAGP